MVNTVQTQPPAEVEATNEELAARLREMSQFKDDVLKLASHDLRSPLALITGYASLVALDVPPDSPIQEYINSIMHATERMTGLLDALMTVEQLRNAKMELDREVAFQSIVQDAINKVLPKIDQRSQTLEINLALDEMPPTILNRQRVREAIEHLLANASKYSTEGTIVVINSWSDAERVYVSVRDEGMGITQEQTTRIFEAFYRGKQPSGQKSDGSGVGLYLVKTIVQRHRGDIWVESEPGKGSEFGFWLPLN